ncbi:MAG TPA: DUF929 family protein [Lapillicoccus sp.]|nr:DUF929 family protein [Lapillicoccus sp.]
MAKSARTSNVRLNQLRAQQQAAERRRRLTIAIAAVAAIVVVVAVLVGVALFGPKQQAAASGPLDAGVYTTLSTIPVATFDQVGVGVGVSNPPTTISAPPLTTDGKPGVLYVGAEYCPFCAAERWPFVVAMTRFGQFANLQATSSGAAPEAYPNTATVSFHGATYTSDVLGFSGVETQTNTNQPLDTLTADQQKIFDTYNPGGSIPFIDYGGKATANGASVDPSIFAGKTQAQIAAEIADPSTATSKAVLGSANVISARLCQLTNNQPAAVCTSPGVTAAAAQQK